MRIKYNYQNIWLLFFFINIFVIFFATLNFKIVVFELAENDGFYQQIQGVISGGVHLLSSVHYLRYIVIYPFVYIENIFGSLLLTLLIMNVYFFCVLALWRSLKTFPILVLFVFFIPYFFSVRAVLCIISIILAYVSLFNIGKVNKFNLILSIIIGNLSSGVLLNILFFCLFKLYQERKALVIYMVPFMILVMFPMVVSKFDFFSNIGNPFYAMIMRNNIFSSIDVNNKKLMLYIAMFFLYFISLLYFFIKRSPNAKVSFLGFCSLVLFEGLGAISISVVIIFLFFSKLTIKR